MPTQIARSWKLEADDVDWTGGGYSCSREVGQVRWQKGGLPNWSFVMKAYDGAVKQLSGQVTRAENCTDVVSNVQLRGVQLYAVPDHVVHGKRQGSHRKCSTRLEYEGVATSLPDVFPEERCKVDGYGGTGSFVRQRTFWQQRLSWRGVYSKVPPRVPEGAGTQRSCACTTRNREHPNVARNRGTPRQGTVERFEERRQQRKEQKRAQVRMSPVRKVWSGHVFKRSVRIRSKRSVLLPERKSQGSDWNRLVCCNDCALEDGGGRFSNAPNTKQSEKLQIRPDCGSECSRGQRQDPRCVTLVRESETGRCAEF